MIAEECGKADLSSTVKDSKVLEQILLIRKLKKLRQILFDEGHALSMDNIHIIAENHDEDICDIALPPDSNSKKLIEEYNFEKFKKNRTLI